MTSRKGPGESGKSTIFKQMQIISEQGGFPEEERLRFRFIVYGNVVSEFKVLIENMLYLQIPFDIPEHQVW